MISVKMDNVIVSGKFQGINRGKIDASTADSHSERANPLPTANIPQSIGDGESWELS